MQTIILKDFECDHVAEHTLYPDGQRSLRLDLGKLDIKEPVTIKCRITSFAALEYLLCLVSALRKNDFYIDAIDFVYLFGMRSDRAFNPGEPNYFREVVASIINSLKVPRISLFRPHSKISLSAIHEGMTCDELEIGIEASVIIKGDQHADFKGAAAFFEKQRHGRMIINTLSAENIEALKSHFKQGNDYPALIVDDMCDAGGTFIAAAESFKNHFDRKLTLYVAHGLFTKGLDLLLEHFEHIYTTNSYQDLEHPRLTQFKVI